MNTFADAIPDLNGGTPALDSQLEEVPQLVCTSFVLSLPVPDSFFFHSTRKSLSGNLEKNANSFST
jgi:hypothetical protein